MDEPIAYYTQEALKSRRSEAYFWEDVEDIVEEVLDDILTLYIDNPYEYQQERRNALEELRELFPKKEDVWARK